MGYPTTAELVALSNDASLTALDSATQDELRGSAISEVERWCGQSFTQEGTTGTPVAKVVDGNGTDSIWLSRRLVELTAIEAIGSFLALGDLIIDEDGARVYVGPGAFGGWLLQAQARITGASPRVFPEGRGVLTLTGIWGWLDTDWTDWETDGRLAPVARAIRYEMEEQAQVQASQLATTVAAARRLGLKTVNEGGVNISLGAQISLGARARRELEPFRWESILAEAV